jgi:hypothetical protein
MYLYYFTDGEFLESTTYLFIYKILGGLFLCQAIPSLIYCVL